MINDQVAPKEIEINLRYKRGDVITIDLGLLIDGKEYSTNLHDTINRIREILDFAEGMKQ